MSAYPPPLAWYKAAQNHFAHELRAIGQSRIARACLVVWVLLIAASIIATALTTHHADALTRARVEAYTAGRAAAIEDFSSTNTAATAEACIGWMAAPHDHRSAVLELCQGASHANR